MRSPFAIFRKHQATMMVATVMLAMFGFIVAPAIQDPTDMPPALIIIFAAGTFGCIAWISGIRKKKSSEYGLIGVVIGTVVGVGLSTLGGPPVVVKADTGDLNEQEMYSLEQQRSIANHFLTQAVLMARSKGDNQFLQPPAPFGFHPDPERDIVITELLRREARELGIVVSDEMVNDYITAVTAGKLGAADVKAIRSGIGISESDLYNILRSELLARLAYQYQYDWSTLSNGRAGGTFLPPEAYWEFYQRLNVRESVGIAPVPIQAFVDKSAEPSETELQQLFDAHRENYPDTSDDGRLDEGRPGFRQPRKVRLAYVEAAYDEIEKQVEQPTDEEIQAFYDEHYKTLPAEQTGTDDAAGNGSAKPTGTPDSTGQPNGPSLPAPGAETETEEKPAEEKPAEKQPDGKIDGDDLPLGEEPGDKKADPGDTASDNNESDTDDSDADESNTGASDADDSDKEALLGTPSSTRLVAFFDDTDGSDAAEEPDVAQEESDVTEAKSDAAQSPESDGESNETPGNRPPAPPLAEPNDAGSDTPTAPPVRELDDTLRGEIRDQILRRRTEDKLTEVINEAVALMRELELRMANLPEDDDYLTHEEALEELRAYAEQNGLSFVETPPLSALELQNSEDYPIGGAVDQLFSDPFNPRPATNVLQQVFRSAPREVYRSQSVIDPETDSRFAYWKIDDQAEYVPESLSDPGIRDQVVDTWRELQAREKAKARAAQLAQMAEEADGPLSEVFAGQTVTGKPDGPAITVLHPAKFSWMTKADPRMSPNPFSTPPPQRTRLRNVPGRIGDSFMKTVFNETREGGVNVAHSIDKSYFYVVRVEERTYGRAKDLQAFREQFLREPVFAPYYASDYPKLAEAELREFQTDWSEALLKKHHVEIIKREPEPTPEDGRDRTASL